MFTSLPALRDDVEEVLSPLLPNGWDIVPYLEGTKKSLTPVVYLEFVRIDTKQDGSPLGRGQYLATFNVIVTDPKTDTEKAENSVDGHLLELLDALDTRDDLFWESAEKRRLPDGPLAWAVSAFAFVTTIPQAA